MKKLSSGWREFGLLSSWLTIKNITFQLSPKRWKYTIRQPNSNYLKSFDLFIPHTPSRWELWFSTIKIQLFCIKYNRWKNVQMISIYFYYTLYSKLKILQKIASSLNLIHTSIQREKSPWFKAVLKQCSRGSAWTGTLSSLLSYWNDFPNVKWVTPRRCPRMERHMSVWHFQNGFIRNVS